MNFKVKWNKIREYKKQHDYKNLIKCLREIKTEEIDENYDLLDILDELWFYADKDDEPDITINYFLEAINIDEKYNILLGLYYLKRQDFINTEKYILIEKCTVYNLWNIAEIYLQMNDKNKALGYYQMILFNFQLKDIYDLEYFDMNHIHIIMNYYLENNDTNNVEKIYLKFLELFNFHDNKNVDDQLADLINNVTTYFKDKDISTFCQCYELLSSIRMKFKKEPSYWYMYYGKDNCWCSSDTMSGTQILEVTMKESWDKLNIIKFYYNCKQFDKFEYYVNKFIKTYYHTNKENQIQELFKMIEEVDDHNIKTISVKMFKQLLQISKSNMQLHFKYAPNAEGYEEAKKHFYDFIIE